MLVAVDPAQHPLGALVFGFGSPIDTESQMDSMLQIAAQVAGQAAIAIENATAYQEIEQLKDQLAEEKLCLQDEIRTERNFGEIVGESPVWRDHIRRVLEKSNWVIGGPNGAATRLGMKRTTLQSKMKKLGIAR